jgi:hypothetical protein
MVKDETREVQRDSTATAQSQSRATQNREQSRSESIGYL